MIEKIEVLTYKQPQFNLMLNKFLNDGWVMSGQLTATNVRGVIYYSVLIAKPEKQKEDEK